MTCIIFFASLGKPEETPEVHRVTGEPPLPPSHKRPTLPTSARGARVAEWNEPVARTDLAVEVKHGSLGLESRVPFWFPCLPRQKQRPARLDARLQAPWHVVQCSTAWLKIESEPSHWNSPALEGTGTLLQSCPKKPWHSFPWRSIR